MRSIFLLILEIVNERDTFRKYEGGKKLAEVIVAEIDRSTTLSKHRSQFRSQKPEVYTVEYEYKVHILNLVDSFEHSNLFLCK